MYTEFLAATLEAHGHIEEERIADAFDRLDSDDSGYISKENLKEFLGDTASDKDIDEIIANVDADNDGQSEFVYSAAAAVLFCCVSVVEVRVNDSPFVRFTHQVFFFVMFAIFCVHPLSLAQGILRTLQEETS